MFTCKKERCERRKDHLSDGRQLKEISNEVCCAATAPGGIRCFAEEQQPATGEAESLDICQCWQQVENKFAACQQMLFKTLCKCFSNER